MPANPPNPDTLDRVALWLPGVDGRRADCDWLLWRRDFECSGTVDAAVLHLFVSTRYRLWVNGQVVGHGPVRFVAGTEEYDSYYIGGRLRAGRNCIAVESCSIECNNFQHDPETGGRFIAGGGVESGGDRVVDFASPGGWRCRRCEAWSEQVPCFSFAIGPIEALDTRRLPEGWNDPELPMGDEWETPEPAARRGAAPRPRSVAPPTGQRLAMTLIHAASVIGGERRVGFVAIHPTSRSSHHEPTRGSFSRYAVCIESPRDQTVTLGMHWGKHFLNGELLSPETDPLLGSRLNAAVRVREGWNLLCGEVEQLGPRHPVLIAFPIRAGLRLGSDPTDSPPGVMRLQRPRILTEGERWLGRPPATFDAIDPACSAWELVVPGGDMAVPAREMAWDRVLATLPPESLQLPMHVARGDGAWTFVFDRGGEYLGYVTVDVDVPAGTVVDVGYDERLRTDGCLNWFASNPFTDTADRYVCRGGRQTLRTFVPRGGRYIQVTLRPSGGHVFPGGATLHGVSVLDARCLPVLDRPYETDNDLHRWVWDTGIATLQASTEDLHCDSPWRERGAYLGDSYVQTLVELCASTDHRMGRRCLRVFAAAQRDDGQLPCVVPGWLQLPHGDFTLIYPIWLHDYWQGTGDLNTVEACMPAVERLLASPTWQTSEHSSLWNATEANRLFICWGCREELRRYDENGVLNALRVQSLRCASAMAAALDRPSEAVNYRRQVVEVVSAYRDRLWIEEQGRFAGGTSGGRVIIEPSIHTNILALAYGLADEHQEPALASYVIDRMRGNAAHAARGIAADDFAELYFLKFVLDAMVRIDRHDIARQVIDDHMRVMRNAGAYAFWESIHRGIQDKGSLCHSWSAAPLVYLHQFANLANPLPLSMVSRR